MNCPKCGKKTIQRFGNVVFLTNPPIYQVEDWCGCGWGSGFREEQAKGEWEQLNERWKEINNIL